MEVKSRETIKLAFSEAKLDENFERALSMPALLTSSRDLGAHRGNDDDDVDPGFGIRGQSVS
jgi:hypothetical protein